MVTPPITRLFQSSDAESVIALWQQVLPSTQPWNDPRDTLCRKANRQDELIFVSELGDQVVGVAMAGYDGVRGWIYRIAVDPKYRRSGIGRGLLERAESTLLALGCPKVNLQVRSTNFEVIEFYRRCGYEVESHASLGKPLQKSSLLVDPAAMIRVTEEIYLSQITCDDKPSFMTHLNESDEFRRNTSTIPYPYTEFDADRWLAKVTSETTLQSRNRNWAIRNGRGELIGGIGLMDISTEGIAEIGYWLAQTYWGKGIVTKSVRSLCGYAFNHYGLRRIHARVLATNSRSSGVLRKADFQLEGTMRSHFFRDGMYHDILLFGLLREESQLIDET